MNDGESNMVLMKLWEWLGCNGSQLMVIITALSVLVTLLMVYYTYRTLKANKKQLEILQKQRDEDMRAVVTFSIEFSNKSYYLIVRNIGKTPAYDVNFTAKHTLIQNGCCRFIKNYYDTLSKKKHTIAPSTCLKYKIAPYDYFDYKSHLWGSVSDKELEKIKNNFWKVLFEEDVVITGSYKNGVNRETILINESIPFSLDTY